MTELLIRLFVPNHTQLDDPAVRGRYGSMAGLVGILCNVTLFLGKLLIGMFSGSVAIMADAVNNLADASSSIMTLLGFHLSRRPADEEHPFGHARFEYLSGLGVAVLILVIGLQMGKSSIEKILNPEPVRFSIALVLVLAVSIALKLWMAVFNRKIGKRISSATLIATATDSRNDVVSTAAVLICALVARISGLELDGYVGLLVAIFIIYSGIGIGKETLRPLLGSPAEPEMLDWMRRTSLDFHPCILGVHDIMVHDYGPGRRFASMHAEIDYHEDVLMAHEVLDELERVFREEHSIELVIHYDPVVMDDAELNTLRGHMLEALALLDVRLGAHDFRKVRAKDRCNLIFDVTVPFDMGKREGEIAAHLEAAAKAVDAKYHTILTFDYMGARPEVPRDTKGSAE